MLEYDFDENRAATPPDQLLAYRGSSFQLPVSVAFGRTASISLRSFLRATGPHLS